MTLPLHQTATPKI